MAARFFGALVDMFGRHRMTGNRQIDIWAETEFKHNAQWAKNFYYRTGRFPSGKDVC
jgi:hypothetical protein